MNDTQKLELIERARAEFERNVKAALGVEHADVSIGVHLNKRMFENAPLNWTIRECQGTRWVTSSLEAIGHTSVFEPPTA